MYKPILKIWTIFYQYLLSNNSNETTSKNKGQMVATYLVFK